MEVFRIFRPAQVLSFPHVPMEWECRRPRLFWHDRALHRAGSADLLPNVPTPKRGRIEAESSETAIGATAHPGSGKRLHVDMRLKRMTQLNVDIQSDNGEFAMRRRVFVP